MTVDAVVVVAVGVLVVVGVVVVVVVAVVRFVMVDEVVGVVAVVDIILTVVVVKESFKMSIFEKDKLLAFTGRFLKYQIPLAFRIVFLTMVFNDSLVISLF